MASADIPASTEAPRRAAFRTGAVRVAQPLVVGRAAPGGTPAAEWQALGAVAADAEATLGPGDSFYGRPFVAFELRNDGAAPAVLLAAPRLTPYHTRGGRPPDGRPGVPHL